MEQKFRFGLVLNGLAIMKKIGLLLWPVFSCLQGQKKIFFESYKYCSMK